MTVDFKDVDALNRCDVSEMERFGNQLDPELPESCEEFGQHVQKVQAALIHTYAMIARSAVRKENPADAAALWEIMRDFCDFTVEKLENLKERFPLCGTPELYDLSLDYRLAAEEGYDQNTRDAECLNLPITPIFLKKN